MKSQLKFPSGTAGTITVDPSKSELHRALICAAFSNAPTTLQLSSNSSDEFLLSDDIRSTISCLTQLGAETKIHSSALTVIPRTFSVPHPVLNCGESGSTLRFLLPVTCALSRSASFLGRGNLPRRPISELTEVLKKNGVEFSYETLPFSTTGRLEPGTYTLPGNISSQYLSGLLMALPLLRNPARIQTTTPLSSRSYVDITAQVMQAFGVNVHEQDNVYTVSTCMGYTSPGTYHLQGDWSLAAAYLAIGALSAKSQLTLTGLDANSTQGDRHILTILKEMGANLIEDQQGISITKSQLHGIPLSMDQTPDLFPVVAVLAAFATGETLLTDLRRLKDKESNRVQSICSLLTALGGAYFLDNDQLTIYGTGLRGGTVHSFQDHRIVMAASIAACATSESIIITDSEAISKSCPSFFQQLTQIGGIVRDL